MKKNTEEILMNVIREHLARVPFLSKPKCYKVFVLNLILNSGLGYGEVMTYLDSLNAYGENEKGWRKVKLNPTVEEKFDALGWEKVVKMLIEQASLVDNRIAA